MDTITIVYLLVVGLIVGSFVNVIIDIVPKGKKFTIRAFYSKKNTIRYPLIELFTVMIFFMVAYKFSFELTIQALFIAFSFSMLLAITMIDIQYAAIPDSINILAGLFAILGAGNILQKEFVDIGIGLTNALVIIGGATLFRYAIFFFILHSQPNT